MYVYAFGRYQKTNDRDAPVPAAFCRLFHHCGMTHEISVDCLEHGVATASQQSFDD